MVQTDRYPTRLAAARQRFPRLDPVVHARNQDRWNGPLDETALSLFERDGYLWFEGFFARERVAPFFRELASLARDPKLCDSEQVIKDPASGELRSVFAMHEVSRRFDELTRDPRLLGIARQILGGDVYLHQSRINDKFAFEGSGFDWHSDFETWHAEDGLPAMRTLSASLMLTHNNEFNGPLMLIPGSHQYFVPCVGETPADNWKDSLKKQRLGVPSLSDVQALAEIGGIEAPKGPPGSLLLFDSNVLHASNANLSPWPRANLFFVYNSVDNLPAAPFCGNSPRPHHLANRRATRPLNMSDPVGVWDVA